MGSILSCFGSAKKPVSPAVPVINLAELKQANLPLPAPRLSALQMLIIDNDNNSSFNSTGSSGCKINTARRQIVLDISRRRAKVKMLQHELAEERSTVDLLILELVQ